MNKLLTLFILILPLYCFGLHFELEKLSDKPGEGLFINNLGQAIYQSENAVYLVDQGVTTKLFDEKNKIVYLQMNDYGQLAYSVFEIGYFSDCYVSYFFDIARKEKKKISDNSKVISLNKKGEVLLNCDCEDTNHRHFAYVEGALIHLTALNDCTIYGINDDSQIAARHTTTYWFSPDVIEGFIYNLETQQKSPIRPDIIPCVVTNDGDILGYRTNGSYSFDTVILKKDGSVKVIGWKRYPSRFNDRGDIIGYSSSSDTWELYTHDKWLNVSDYTLTTPSVWLKNWRLQINNMGNLIGTLSTGEPVLLKMVD